MIQTYLQMIYTFLSNKVTLFCIGIVIGLLAMNYYMHNEQTKIALQNKIQADSLAAQAQYWKGTSETLQRQLTDLDSSIAILEQKKIYVTRNVPVRDPLKSAIDADAWLHEYISTE